MSPTRVVYGCIECRVFVADVNRIKVFDGKHKDHPRAILSADEIDGKWKQDETVTPESR